MSNIIHVDFGRADACVRCRKPVSGEFNLPDGRWHWDCWKLAHPRTRADKPRIDTAYFEDDDEMETGWYGIVRTQLGADLWCGPHDTKAQAIKAARRKVNG